MQGSLFSGAPLVLITDNMERIVLPASMMGALRRARDFGRRTGAMSSDHPLNDVVENAISLPGAISLAPVPEERQDALFADVKVKNGKVGDTDKCPICLVEWEDEDEIVISRCAHAFHKQCIREWVQPGMKNGLPNRDKCPMCRAQL
tara:strand:+ start:3583 stop:4023 length:441 start_codon:yes stop_codon:yes gene_type:complete